MRLSSPVIGVLLTLVLGVMAGAFYISVHPPATVAGASPNSPWTYTPRSEQILYTHQQDRHTLTYDRHTVSETILSSEISRLLRHTNMSLDNQASVVGAALLNETVTLPTETPCGFSQPSSEWCFRLVNLPDNRVELAIQPDPFVGEEAL